MLRELRHFVDARNELMTANDELLEVIVDAAELDFLPLMVRRTPQRPEADGPIPGDENAIRAIPE
ncbi:hypothetical protein [Demequina rhizosphaerae]|uniref:hypothetical protein n=1 Tax=Demequina rhizosphaerae TaxID=1638985 RepID=UPI0007866C3A|nr:hypothetical protein [Demequina rhizosphaerae]